MEFPSVNDTATSYGVMQGMCTAGNMMLASAALCNTTWRFKQILIRTITSHYATDQAGSGGIASDFIRKVCGSNPSHVSHDTRLNYNVACCSEIWSVILMQGQRLNGVLREIFGPATDRGLG